MNNLNQRAQDLFDLWVNGNRSDVLGELSGATRLEAAFMAVVIARQLSDADGDEAAIRFMDRLYRSAV